MQIFKYSISKIPLRILTFFICTMVMFPSALFAEFQDVVDTRDSENVFLYVGDLVTVKVSSLTRIAIANPSIVDVTNAAADEITLVGRKVGETQIFVWESTGKRQIVARVLGSDLERISQRITALIQSSGIKGVSLERNYYEGKIILSGLIAKNDKDKVEKLLENFNDVIINMLVEEGEMIQIDVQFSELNTTLSKALGFDWTQALSFQESIPTQDGSLGDLFKLGDFSRTTAIVSAVNFLLQEGKARILSKPSLVVTNGEEASFLVGGEIPILSTVTSNGGTSTQENVTFKSYGVELTVTPEIKDGKIDIQINVTVRDVDSSNSVGDNVAFTTRTATTKVRLTDGQTIVLAGMIQRRKTEAIKRIPFLSKIPIVGLLFQLKNSTPDTDIELVVSLTPRVLKNLPLKNTALAKSSQPETKNIIEKNMQEGQGANSSKSKISEDTQSAEMEAPPGSAKTAVSANSQEEKMEETGTASPEVEKSAAQLKAEKKAAAAKAKAEKRAAAEKAKAEALKAKKEKAAKAKQEKEERARAKKEAREKKKQLVATDKTKTKSAPVPAQAVPQPAVKTYQPPIDPSLNMAIDDPRLVDPQNILKDEEIKDIENNYISKIKNEMSDSIAYPYEAKASGWEGTAILNLTILPDGNVKDVVIKQSSGYAIFDKDAVNTAQILAPYDRFMPAKNLRELNVTIPVEYSEKAILGEMTR